MRVEHQVTDIESPQFSSREEFLDLIAEVEFWKPYVHKVLKRHELLSATSNITAGIGATYPTFLLDNFVVKFFGYTDWCQRSFDTELKTYRVINSVPELLAPKLIASGDLLSDGPNSWSYMIYSKLEGVTWGAAELSCDQKVVFARHLGSQIALMQSIEPDLENVGRTCSIDALVSATEQSSFPKNLIPEIEEFISGTIERESDIAFVHGDLMHRHVFVDKEKQILVGIIDWGDATVTNHHYELAKLHLDLFECDKNLLEAFLTECCWPVVSDFSKQALCQALYRQAFGMEQHHTMDVFHKIPNLISGKNLRSLDELADFLFAI